MAEPLAAQAAAEDRQGLPPELRRVARILCEVYQSLDLRIETTLAAAAHDFVAALPEMAGHDDALRYLVALLTADLRGSGVSHQAQPVLLRLRFRDEAELECDLLSSYGNFQTTEHEA